LKRCGSGEYLEFLESIKKETKRERSKKKSEYFPTIKKEIFPTIKKEYWADIKKDNNLIKPDIFSYIVGKQPHKT
jgi:hypothetical protein